MVAARGQAYMVVVEADSEAEVRDVPTVPERAGRSVQTEEGQLGMAVLVADVQAWTVAVACLCHGPFSLLWHQPEDKQLKKMIVNLPRTIKTASDVLE